MKDLFRHPEKEYAMLLNELLESFGFTDEYIADYFVRHPEKDYATLNELLDDANSLYGTLLEEIGLRPFESLYLGSVFGYANPNKPAKIIF